jgi:hypothetical protein
VICGAPPSCDAHVPGDYGTIQGAITALRGTNKTVCVADGTYNENLTDGGVIGAITITGSSAANVTINGSVTLPFIDNATTFANVTITKGLTTSGKVTLRACVIQGGVTGTAEGGLLNKPCILDVDACDISNPGGTALHATRLGIQYTVIATVQNSYLHGAAVGIAADSAGGGSCSSITFVNNTIQGVTTGMWNAVGGCAAPTYQEVLFANNLITGAKTAIVSAQFGDFHDNAFWGNTTNYSGGLMPGTGDVTADPMLTGTTPPGLSAGSPLIGAGDATLVPMCDYFGKPRNGRADIGAVEGP